MSVSIQQVDTAPEFAAGAYCSGLSAGANAGVVNRATQGGSAGVTEDSVTVNNGETNVRYLYYECDIPSGYDGAAGTWVVRINQSSGTVASGGYASVYVCRVNSSGTNQETLGSNTSTGADFSATGVKTINVSQASGSTFSAGDKVMVVVGLTGPTTMVPFIFGITPDQIITAPGSVSSGTIKGTGALIVLDLLASEPWE